ncbi:MAG: hypothetical protein AAF628_19495 [Planctomycetota bacterium]
MNLHAWLYQATLVPHALCAGYVTVGSLWLAGLGLRRAPEGAAADPIAELLRDWLPFVLGLAITFGVGPLLFVQLLDGPAFYTANLLLSHRFMALLPALMIGFYLLYVQKSGWRWTKTRVARVALPASAFACFAFTAWSWSRNHLLAQRPSTWPAAYADPSALPQAADLLPRLMLFFGLGLQATALLLLVQAGRIVAADARLRARLAGAAGLGLAVLLAGGWFLLPDEVRHRPPLVALGVAQVALLAGWLMVSVADRDGVLGWAVGWALGWVVGLIATATIASIGALAWMRRAGNQQTEGTAGSGAILFGAVLITVAIAIAWAVRRVVRDLGQPTD